MIFPGYSVLRLVGQDVAIEVDRSVQDGSGRLDLMLRPMLRSSPKRSQSRIFVSQRYRVRVSHVSVNPSCRGLRSKCLRIEVLVPSEVRQ